MLDIKRREFIALVGGGGRFTAKVRRGRAQQPATVRPLAAMAADLREVP
jgi:hypothetical protein